MAALHGGISHRTVFSHVPATKVREVSHMLKAIHAQESRDVADAMISTSFVLLRDTVCMPHTC